MSSALRFAVTTGFLMASAVSAQEIRATLSGRVVDPSGSSVPGAKVVILKYDITPEPLRYGWLRGPGFAEHNAVFFKTVRIVERVSFELRAEVHNLPNTPQWGNPATDISNPRTFGQITSGGNPRNVRFTGRVVF